MESAEHPRRKKGAAALFAALVFVPALFFSSVIAGREISRLYALAWSLFAGGAAFAVAYTGKVSPWRRAFFSVSALAFLVHFKARLLAPALDPTCLKDAPYCHIAMAPYFLNYLYQQYLALMSGGWKMWGPLTLGALWLFVTLAIGRGWCSWACFYGGIDDGLSAVPRRPLLRLGRWALRLRDLPAALLIFFMLVSLANMLPAFCLWLCPFKVTGSFLDGQGWQRTAQYALLFSALAALLLGPLLTGKRIFCSYLCPFAAWQAFWGRLNPFRVTLVPALCTGCAVCARECPMTAISCAPGGKPEILAYCNLCGRCLEACPGAGLRYTLFGLQLPPAAGFFAELFTVKYFYVFSALTLAAAFSSLWAPAALRDIVHWVWRG